MMMFLFVLVVVMTLSSTIHPSHAAVIMEQQNSVQGFRRKLLSDVLDLLHDYEIHSLDHQHGRNLLNSKGLENLEYELPVQGRRLMLDLEINREIFAPDYKHMIVDEHGNMEEDKDVDLECIYKAKVRGDDSSIGVVNLCGPGMRASVHHGSGSDRRLFYVQPIDEEGKDHVVFLNEHVKNQTGRCGVGTEEHRRYLRERNLMENGEPLQDDDVHSFLQHHIKKEEEQAFSAEDSSSGRRKLAVEKTVRIYIGNDHRRFLQFQQNTHAHSAQLIAAMSNLYTQFPGTAVNSYRFQLTGMVTFRAQDPYPVQPTITNNEVSSSELLDVWDDYRVAKILNIPTHTLAMLFTGYDVQSSTIGLAFLGTACRTRRSSFTQATNMIDGLIVSTAAHEAGHNLNFQHTDEDPPGAQGPCTGNFIMNPSSGSTPNVAWSNCEVVYSNNYFSDNALYTPQCMEAAFPAPVTFSLNTPVCGDGLREGSEQCDCPNKDCSGIDPCCDGNTCQFILGATCSAQDTCCNSCQIITNTSFACRPSSGECDDTEFCTGTSGVCPVDSIKGTGTPCTLPEPGICFNKECLSHEDQCKDADVLITNAVLTGECSSADENDSDDACKKLKCAVQGSPSCATTTIDVKDGTACDFQKACYLGNCVAYTEIPIPGRTTCNNGELDEDEINLDCGGPLCFGCEPGSKCTLDRDCAFPSTCNITDANRANPINGTVFGTCSPYPVNTRICAQCPDWFEEILQFIVKNPEIVGGAAAGVLVLCIAFCCCRCKRAETVKAQVHNKHSLPQHQQHQQYEEDDYERGPPVVYYDQQDINSYPVAQKS